MRVSSALPCPSLPSPPSVREGDEGRVEEGKEGGREEGRKGGGQQSRRSEIMD